MAFAAVRVLHDRAFLPLDTQQVLVGVLHLDNCAHAHVFKACQTRDGGEIGPFPVLQYAIGLASKRAGASYATTAHLLVDLSAAAALGVVLLLAFAARRMLPRRTELILVLLGLTGPIAWYSEAGFAEALAMMLTLLAVLVMALRRPWFVTAPLVFIAGLTKETAPIFLVCLAAILVLWNRERLPKLLAPTGAALAAAAVNGLFNLWRYGVLYNDYYAEPARHTPGLGLKAQFFAGQLVSPSAGLLWFWPVAVMLLLVALWPRRTKNVGERRAATALVATIVALVGLFAAYHSPYGWIALGPRYLLPWVPSLCLLAALVGADRVEAALTALSTRRAAAILLATVVSALAVLEVGAFVDPLAPLALFDGGKECAYLPVQELQAFEQPNYYDCVTSEAWTQRPMLLHALRPLGEPVGILLGVLMVIAIALTARALRSRGSGELRDHDGDVVARHTAGVA